MTAFSASISCEWIIIANLKFNFRIAALIDGFDKTVVDRMLLGSGVGFWRACEQLNDDLLEGEQVLARQTQEHPEIMTQGRTLKELEANLRDAYRMMFLVVPSAI